MKTQYLAIPALSTDQLSVIDAASVELETTTVGLNALTEEQKQQLRTMGPRSESFCRNALNLMQQHPQLLAPTIPLAAVLAELKVYDEMRPRVARLVALVARLIDSQYARSSNIMSVALEGYNQLRRLGRTAGLKQACDELGVLFSRSRAKLKNRQAAPGTEPGS